MSIPIGTSISDGLYIVKFSYIPADDGKTGAKSGGLASGDASSAQHAIEMVELVGKIGAVIEPHNPEGDRLIQEF